MSAVYGAMGIIQLKELLRDKGLKISGNKSVLVQRLVDDENEGEGGNDLITPVPREDDTSNIDSETVSRLLVPFEDEAKARDMVSKVVHDVESVVITNSAEQALAGEILTKQIKPALKFVDGLFNPIKKSWHDGHKQTIDTHKRLRGPIEEAETKVKRALADWEISQEELRENERRELAIKLRDDAIEELTQQAADLISSGQVEAGTALLGSLEDDTPVELPAVMGNVNKVAGVSTRKVWKFDMVDESKVNRAYLVPDLRKIRDAVKVSGLEAEVEIGGITVFQDTVVTARAL